MHILIHMSKHIDLDVSQLEPQHTINNQNNFNLNSMMQLHLLSKLNTGNPFIDSMAYTLAMSFMPVFASFAGNILNYIKIKILYLISLLYNIILKFCIFLYCKYVIGKQIEYFNKTVEINYITDNKNINELYKAVYWYLSNAEEIDFVKETPLKMAFEKKIQPGVMIDLDNESIQKYVTNNTDKKFNFNNHDINYRLSNELIKIYSDKERQRENYKIELWVKMDKCSKTDIIEDFCKFCLVEYKKSLTNSVWKQKIFINNGNTWKSEDSNNKRNIDTIILQNDLKDEIKKDINTFLNSEEWYHHRDIPYTRGYLFYGPPGTGKTSMIKAISLLCKRNIGYLALSNVQSDIDLLTLLKSINYKETILVIEDIDCMEKIVRDRNIQLKEEEHNLNLSIEELKEKKKEQLIEKYNSIDKPSYKNNEYYDSNTQVNNKESKLTLSGILNALDGVFAADGRILIMTTNKPDVLDSALLRSGRVDRKFLFDFCNKEQIKELYEMFFNKKCISDHLDKIEDRMYSPAQITGLFTRYRNDPEEVFKHIDDEEELPSYDKVKTKNKLHAK